MQDNLSALLYMEGVRACGHMAVSIKCKIEKRKGPSGRHTRLSDSSVQKGGPSPEKGSRVHLSRRVIQCWSSECCHTATVSIVIGHLAVSKCGTLEHKCKVTPVRSRVSTMKGRAVITVCASGGCWSCAGCRWNASLSEDWCPSDTVASSELGPPWHSRGSVRWYCAVQTVLARLDGC